MMSDISIVEIGIKPFVNFAYGDKRSDAKTARRILAEKDTDYDPAKDFHKQFREAMKKYEEAGLSKAEFLELYKSVSHKKAKSCEILCKNYLDLKEDHALLWEGHQRITAQFDNLRIQTAWHLRTDVLNQRRIVYLNFLKDPFPRNQERGLLTILQVAAPDSAGVGILNIQAGTLVVASRIDQNELVYLNSRAKKFLEYCE